jgi:hypothetical protein
VQTHCAGWRPIRPSRQDVLTRGTQEQIVGHNEAGEAFGCWHPQPHSNSVSSRPFAIE